MATVFDHVPHSPRGHFRLNFYAAVTRLIAFLADGDHGLDAQLGRFPFLAGYLAELRRNLPPDLPIDETAPWWEREIASWEAATGEHLPLRALAALGVDHERRMALMLAGLVDEDSRFGAIFAQLQEPAVARRSSLEALGQIVAGPNPASGVEAWDLCRVLIDAHLIQVGDESAPRSGWQLRVPAPVWGAIKGEETGRPTPWSWYRPPSSFALLADLILAPDLRHQLARIPPLLAAGQVGTLVLRGMPGSQRLDIAGAIARELGRGLLEIDVAATDGDNRDEVDRRWALHGPLSVLLPAMPVVTADLGPGETVDLPAPAGGVPLAVLMGSEGGLRGTGAAAALTISLPVPAVAERERLWQQAVGETAVDGLRVISEHARLPGGLIQQAGRAAVAYAALDGRDTVRLSDFRQACRTLYRDQIESLATRLEATGSWGQLVVGESTAAKLRELELRCQHRELVLDHLGPAFTGSATAGVKALFTGASGTGKTLAACILAAELGMDIYRVDLGAVVNKYIGETEKNLHRVLAKAEELDVILLLDEGDALLSNRTEVKSANDRYANLETNYLLQRLEHHQGIVLITTNAGQYIDDAFQRRLDVVIEFFPPGVTERRAIWALHLPPDLAVDWSVLDAVAARDALTGGQIRNAALHATLLAVADGGQLHRWHLEDAIASEYRKAGALAPREVTPAPSAPAGTEAFLRFLTS